MTVIENQTFGQERALYGSRDVIVRNCAFDGEEDGESALKESQNVVAENIFCNLRYPFWHNSSLKIKSAEMTSLCRAALWYCDGVDIEDSRLHGIKALRECSNVHMKNCDVISPEFGWSVRGLDMTECSLEGEYLMMRSEDIRFCNVKLKGKYSFQYIQNAVLDGCDFDTKDAFWHAKNVTVRNSVIKGEYLAWYAEGLTFENCTLIGTQPLCYCKGLRLINCEMVKADLSFERSEVEATLRAPIVSIKNVASGSIRVPSVEHIIMDDVNAHGQILIGDAT